MKRAFALTAIAAAVLAAAAAPAAAPVTQISSILLDGGDARSLSGANADFAAAQAPDGRLAFLRLEAGGSGLWTMAADGSGQQRLASATADSLAPPAWSPKGGEIALAEWDDSPCLPTSRNCALSELRLIDAGTGALRRTVRSRDRGIGAFSWAPDGRRIALLGELDFDLAAHTLEIADGARRRVLIRATGLREVAWSPRGDRIAFVRAGWIWQVRPTGGGAVKLARGSALRWSPRGDRLLFAVGGTLRIADPATKRSRLLARADTALQSWSPNGRLVAYAVSAGTGSSLHVLRVSDGRRLHTTRVSGRVASLFFSRDGTRLVYAAWMH